MVVKEELLESVDVSGYEVAPADVLVLIYKRASVTAGGVHLPDMTLQEDRWQGKVGLVLKVGAGAFVDSARVKFSGFSAKRSDWVVFSPSDGWPLQLGRKDCRQLEDVCIRAVIPDPDFVY